MASPAKSLTDALLLMTIAQLMLCAVMMVRAYIPASEKAGSLEVDIFVPNVLPIRIVCLLSLPQQHAWTAITFHLVRRVQLPAARAFAILATP